MSVVVTPGIAPVVEFAATGVGSGGATLVGGLEAEGRGAEPLGVLSKTLAGVLLAPDTLALAAPPGLVVVVAVIAFGADSVFLLAGVHAAPPIVVVVLVAEVEPPDNNLELDLEVGQEIEVVHPTVVRAAARSLVGITLLEVLGENLLWAWWDCLVRTVMAPVTQRATKIRRTPALENLGVTEVRAIQPMMSVSL